jgi:hypothetical protein
VVVLACCLSSVAAGCGSSSNALPKSSASDASASFADAQPCTESPGASGEPCGCQGDCVDGAQCRWVFGPSSTGWAQFNVCTAIASGTCEYGYIIDDRCTNGAFCLRSSRGDAPGLCLTPDEKTSFCTTSLAEAFLCDSYGSKDAGGPWLDGFIP